VRRLQRPADAHRVDSHVDRRLPLVLRHQRLQRERQLLLARLEPLVELEPVLLPVLPDELLTEPLRAVDGEPQVAPPGVEVERPADGQLDDQLVAAGLLGLDACDTAAGL
jgi:hypothetical protein